MHFLVSKYLFFGRFSEFAVNTLLLTCILYCDAGPGELELFANTVRVVSYHGYYICPRAVFL